MRTPRRNDSDPDPPTKNMIQSEKLQLMILKIAREKNNPQINNKQKLLAVSNPVI
jgi:hypothetical protein